MALSACDWFGTDTVTVLPQYEFEATLELSRNDAFVRRVESIAQQQQLTAVSVRYFPGFGSTSVDIEAEDFIIIISNGGERMEHRTDALCAVVGCEIADETKYTTYTNRFYCNFVECDLEELKLTAQQFRAGIQAEFSVTELIKREYPDP